MNWRNLFGGDKPAPTQRTALLIVRVNGREVATIDAGDVPCEVTPAVELDAAATIEFEDAAGTVHRHHVPADRGWLQFSVRVHPTLGCQAEAVVTAKPDHPSGAALGEDEIGIRFQPFFLAGAPAPAALAGRGLFARGLHFAGLITPGYILLSCECDRCARTFIARSFHAGFAQVAYFYSESGRYTLTVHAGVEGAPAPLSEPDPAALAACEARLPDAPDGTRFAWLNPFRCPHCSAPFVDFATFPDQRAGEYYGLYWPDTPPIRFVAKG